jgi:RecJ-like exonuclease
MRVRQQQKKKKKKEKKQEKMECPDCRGKGKVGVSEVTCPRCRGRGWVWIEEGLPSFSDRDDDTGDTNYRGGGGDSWGYRG